MQRFTTQSSPRGLRCNSFTLIELLTVLAIVAALMGLTVGVVRNSGGQNAAVRHVAQQIYLARQHAISKREHVAILFPNDAITSAQKQYYTDYLAKALRSVIYLPGSPPTYQDIPGTNWIFLPKGVGVSLSMDGIGTETLDDVTLVSGGSALDGVECLVFQPNGSLMNPVRDGIITIRKLGSNDEINTGPLLDNEVSIATIRVNALTGRVTISEARHGN